MNRSLADWMTTEHTQEQIIDMLAQLLTVVADGTGKLVLSQLQVSDADLPDDPYGTLACTASDGGYDATVRPLRVTDTAADDVFVAGLLLSVMLTGRYPDLEMAEMLLISAQAGGAVPLLHLPSSSLNPLLERMTDVNAVTRISAQEALDWLAGYYQSTARVCAIETQTQAALQQQDIPLTGAKTLWTPPTELHCSGQTLFPVDGTAQALPYRVKRVEYEIAYSTNQEAAPVQISTHAAEGTCAFGVDMGAHRVIVARLDAQGQLSEGTKARVELSSVMAFATPQQSVFAAEAERLCAETSATLCHCICPTQAPSQTQTHCAADGATVQCSNAQAMEALLAECSAQMTERLGYRLQGDAVAFSLPAGASQAFATALLRAAEAIGMHAYCVGGAAAAALAATAICEETDADAASARPVMVLDAGSHAVNIAILTEAAMDDLEMVQAPGGDAMTEVLYQSMVQTLNVRHGIHLYQPEDSGMSPAQFADNQARVRAAAERVKRQLSFSERADCTLSLAVNHVDKTTVQLTFLRTQYDNMLGSILTQTRSAMQQCLHTHHVTLSELGCLIVTGGAAVTPAIQTLTESFVRGSGCRLRMLHSSVAAARGAAMVAARQSTHTEQSLSETAQDYGTLTMNAVSGLPLFTCLLPAGTPFCADSVSFSYDYLCTERDLDDRHGVVHKLYTRQRGMSHVQSTLDPDGKAIAYLGQVRVTVPEEYVYATDMLRFLIAVDGLAQPTVTVSHLRKSGGMRRLLSKIGRQKEAQSDGWTVLSTVQAVEWIAAAQKG